MVCHAVTLISETGQVHSLVARSDETLLDAALNARLPVAYSCRTGECGSCRAVAVDASGRVETGAELLLCQTRAEGPMQLRCGFVDGLAGQTRQRLPMRVSALERLAPDVMRLTLSPPPGQGMSALPGQYLDVLLRGGVRRSYSMARPVASGDAIELHLRLVPHGVCTPHVFDGMKPGEVVRVEGPYGSFFRRADSLRSMLMLATGTGFAPLQAIIEAELASGGSRPMVLYWGGRTEADLYLDALCRQWALEHPRFTYRPVLDHAGERWTGRRGFIQDAVLADCASLGHDLRDWEAYACGSGAMVASARSLLVAQAGLPPEHFHSDAFSPASPAAVQGLQRLAVAEGASPNRVV